MKLTLILLSLSFFLCNCTEDIQQAQLISSEEVKALTSMEAKCAFLEEIRETDQAVRGEEARQYDDQAYRKIMREQDSINLQKMEVYLERFGYPTKEEFGENAAVTPWLVIQHQPDIEVRNRYFEAIYEAHQRGDVDDIMMYLYLDRNYHISNFEQLEMADSLPVKTKIRLLLDALELGSDFKN
jgi:hypothetical protein